MSSILIILVTLLLKQVQVIGLQVRVMILRVTSRLSTKNLTWTRETKTGGDGQGKPTFGKAYDYKMGDTVTWEVDD